MKERRYIGIDPAFRERGFGVAVCDTHGKIEGKVYKGYNHFVKWLFEEMTQYDCYFCIENSNLQKTSFRELGWNVNTAHLKGTSVGKNQAVSQLTVDVVRGIFGDESCLELSPQQKGAKIEDDRRMAAFMRTYGVEFASLPKTKEGKQDIYDATKLLCIMLGRMRVDFKI